MKQNTLGDWPTRRAHLWNVLRDAVPDGDSVDLDRLNAYITAQLDGEQYLTAYPDIAQLLDYSPEMAAAYARLYDLEAELRAAALLEPAVVPEPDLSFLPTAVDRWQQLQTRLEEVGQQIRLHLSNELLALFPPPTDLASSMTRSVDDDNGEPLFQIPQDDYGNRLFQLTAYRDQARPAFCLVEVILEPPGKSWPDLAGSTVRLEIATQQWEAVTDNWGTATFSDIPIVGLATMTVLLSF